MIHAPSQTACRPTVSGAYLRLTPTLAAAITDTKSVETNLTGIHVKMSLTGIYVRNASFRKTSVTEFICRIATDR